MRRGLAGSEKTSTVFPQNQGPRRRERRRFSIEWRARKAFGERALDIRSLAPRIDPWLRRFGALLLVVFALIYYGQYYRSDLNLGGEGGTEGVIAMRLNEGALPIVDTFLGYNVMWFYPIAWLFRAVGPDYVALRIYFFAICLAMAVVAFLTVRRVTGQGWLAVGTGLLIVLIPGMLFRNYMGFLPVLNAYLLLQAFVLESRPGRSAAWRWIWWALAGLGLGLTLLVRVDLGLFIGVIATGLVVLYPLGVRGEFRRRLVGAVAAGAVLCLGVFATHFPVYLDAANRGFGAEFLGQYPTEVSRLRYQFNKDVMAAAPEPASDWRRVANQAPAASDGGDVTRPRESLGSLFEQESFYDAAFVIALHLPLAISAIIFIFAGAGLAWAIVARDRERRASSLTCLVTLGCALTLFPQYYFFRPDTPHLSEFMCPFLVAMVCASWHAVRWSGSSWALRVPSWAFVGLCLIGEGLYFYHSFPKESAGTIAASRKRSHEFIGDNGVRVWLKRREQERIAAIYEAVSVHSQPDDWVVTFPYSPTINFMTNRRSYLRNLYNDNASVESESKWIQNAIRDIREKRPAVIVISDEDINQTEYSRFKNWAAPVRDHVRMNYVLIGVFKEYEIFVRPDRLTPDYQPKGGVNAVEMGGPQA